MPKTQPGRVPGFLLSGGVRVRITIEVRSRRLVIDWSRVEPAELRVGFRGA